MTDGAAPLRVEGITRRFGDFTAVRDLSLEVRPGEILGFLGPNGAGKTTTLRCCSGLLKPDAGEVVVAGCSLAREPIAAKRALGLVPDRPFLYERLTGAEFLDFVAAVYGVSEAEGRARAAVLFERLSFDAAGDPVETYSLGMRQKISIVAALMHEPPLLMLDEPLNGLDPFSTRALKDLLRERAARGAGALVSTHLLDVAERLCDRVVILHHGEKRAEGTLDELRGAQAGATLEDVFLSLTRDAERDG